MIDLSIVGEKKSNIANGNEFGDGLGSLGHIVAYMDDFGAKNSDIGV